MVSGRCSERGERVGMVGIANSSSREGDGVREEKSRG